MVDPRMESEKDLRENTDKHMCRETWMFSLYGFQNPEVSAVSVATFSQFGGSIDNA